MWSSGVISVWFKRTPRYKPCSAAHLRPRYGVDNPEDGLITATNGDGHAFGRIALHIPLTEHQLKILSRKGARYDLKMMRATLPIADCG